MSSLTAIRDLMSVKLYHRIVAHSGTLERGKERHARFLRVPFAVAALHGLTPDRGVVSRPVVEQEIGSFAHRGDDQKSNVGLIDDDGNPEPFCIHGSPYASFEAIASSALGYLRYGLTPVSLDPSEALTC